MTEAVVAVLRGATSDSPPQAAVQPPAAERRDESARATADRHRRHRADRGAGVVSVRRCRAVASASSAGTGRRDGWRSARGDQSAPPARRISRRVSSTSRTRPAVEAAKSVRCCSAKGPRLRRDGSSRRSSSRRRARDIRDSGGDDAEGAVHQRARRCVCRSVAGDCAQPSRRVDRRDSHGIYDCQRVDR